MKKRVASGPLALTACCHRLRGEAREWLLVNSKPEAVTLPEPTHEKVREFMEKLAAAHIQIRGKTLRGARNTGGVPWEVENGGQR